MCIRTDSIPAGMDEKVGCFHGQPCGAAAVLFSFSFLKRLIF